MRINNYYRIAQPILAYDLFRTHEFETTEIEMKFRIRALSKSLLLAFENVIVVVLLIEAFYCLQIYPVPRANNSIAYALMVSS